MPRRLRACPLCGSSRLKYVFSKPSVRVERCEDCRLMLLNPQTSDAHLASLYNSQYFLVDDADGSVPVTRIKRATARGYLREIGRYRPGHGGSLLEIGCGQGDFLVEAQALGYAVTGIDVSAAAVEQAQRHLGESGRVLQGEVKHAELTPHSFDICVLSDVIEQGRDPIAFLCAVRELLKPDGVLFIATPSLDSWSARMLRANWMEFKAEHLFYFDRLTIQNALFRAGFHEMIVQPGWKTLNLDYVARHFGFSVPMLTPLIRLANRLSPAPLRIRNFPIVASGMTILARAKPLSRRDKLSVILPVYNEAATFETVLTGLLHKELPNLDLEIIVVESNSTDGTREIACRYQNHARVRLVLQDRPRGKGHAVRAGLQEATGEFVLIQDADLEYDLEDYAILLEPLVTGREAFVLGARHGGNAWKMRQFEDRWPLATVLNFGHWIFTSLVNVLFGLRLKDPFTMYKVFRRDCLFGLALEYNRFDFDYELLIKLARKGYIPLEIPINYRSRSFREGKKVSVLRDPLTWLWALARLRLTAIDPLGVVERQRRERGDSSLTSSK